MPSPPPGAATPVGRSVAPLVDARSLAAWAARLTWAAVAVGIALRLVRYLADRSLWLDESFLSLNVINRPWSRLFGTLDFAQGAPPGFLALEKLAVTAFGSGEEALRLVPLLWGCATLVLVAVAARRLLPAPAVPLAVLLVACVEPLVRYSAEVKQYSSDAAVAVGLAALAGPVLRGETGRRASRRRTAALAVAGGAAVWLSHPAVFVLAALGLAWATCALRRRSRSELHRATAAATCWTASFAAFYVTLYRNLGDLQDAVALDPGTASGYAPFPPTSGGDLRWYPEAAHGLLAFAFDLRSPLTMIALAALLAGVVAVARRSPGTALLLGVPVLLAAAASMLHRYPFTGRMLLFTVPFLLLLGAEGAVVLARAVARAARASRPGSRQPAAVARVAAGAAAAVALVGVVVWPAGNAAASAVDPPQLEQTRPLIELLQQRARPGDALYLFPSAQYAYRYYALDRGLNTRPDGTQVFPVRGRSGSRPYSPALDSGAPRVVVGRENDATRAGAVPALPQLAGHRRVWLLFSHVPDADRDGWRRITAGVDRLGTRLGSWSADGAALLLYDFTRQAPVGAAAPAAPGSYGGRTAAAAGIAPR